MLSVSIGPDEWTGQTRSGENVELKFDAITEKVGISAPSVDASYFIAPSKRGKNERICFLIISVIDVFCS
jgi:hypothetical protein